MKFNNAFSGLTDTMGVDAAALASAIESCHDFITIFGKYRVYESMEVIHRDFPASLLRLIVCTDLHCQQPQRSNEEILTEVGLGPGGASTFADAVHNLDTALQSSAAMVLPATAVTRNANVKETGVEGGFLLGAPIV